MHEDIQIHIRPAGNYIIHIRYKNMIHKGRSSHGMDIKCIIQIKYV